MRPTGFNHSFSGLAALAALLVLGGAPSLSSADPPGGFHGADHGGFHGGFRGRGAQVRMRGGMRFGGDPRFGGPRYAHPRFAGPSHWVGLHPRWDGDGGPRPWVRPWGPRWEPHYWRGGDWDGRFWPRVDFDWDFPWFLTALPFGFQTFWWGDVPYYYWQGVYYVWSPDYSEYVVTDPPPLTAAAGEAGTAPPPAAAGGAGGALSLYVYPEHGQSKQQEADDRYACHEWAVGETGFDPINPSKNTQAATATPSSYKRAVTACLEARGYSVR